MADDPSPAAVPHATDTRSAEIEHIRKRPQMYVGSVDQRGLHVMLFELVQNALASPEPRTTGSLHVSLKPDGSAEIADDSWWLLPEMRGIELRQLETVLKRFLAGPDQLGRWWVSALSEWFTVEVRHAGRRCRQGFRRGEPAFDPVVTNDPGPSVLKVAFRPDPAIFRDHIFDPDTVRERLWECAFLHGGVRISLADGFSGCHHSFHHPDGVRAHVEWLDGGRPPLHPDTLVVRGTRDGVRFEVGLRWCEEHEPITAGFANGEGTPQDGTHVTGVRAAVTHSLNEFIRKHAPGLRELQGDETRLGLTTVVSVWLSNPTYEGATQGRLSNDSVRWAVGSGVGEFLRDTFEADRDLAVRVIRAAQARPHDLPMSDAEWESSTDHRRMLRVVGERGTLRRSVLFAAACCRRNAVERDETLHEAMEAYAEGALDQRQLRRATANGARMRQVRSSVSAADFNPRDAAWLATTVSGNDEGTRAELAALVRDIFGNPNRPLAVDPSWRTSTVLALAKTIHNDRAFDLMPILADALQDAGCDDADILDHCRGTATHARGCWVIDLLRGKS